MNIRIFPVTKNHIFSARSEDVHVVENDRHLCMRGVHSAYLRPLRPVFTSDGVVVGVVVRSVARCDLVKIKPTESEAEHCIRL